MIDLNLKQWATEKQWAYLEAVEKHGSGRKAAAAIGMDKSAINRSLAALRAKAAQHGYSPDHDLVHPSAPGFKVKGTSTLYDDGGNVRAQWVKTTIDQEAQAAALQAALDAATAYIWKAPATKAPKVTSDDLLTTYPIGDHHLGMLAWAQETGEDYDINISKAVLRKAMAHLVEIAPVSKRCLIAVGGDFMHYDSFKPVTPTSGNLLDADSRFPKMVEAAIEILLDVINMALAKHEQVEVIVEPGNHDLSGSIWMMHLLANVFAREKRVRVNTSPMHFHFYQFGKVMIMTHHGHGVKPEQLPIIMATDQPKMWGETVHRVAWFFHVHHNQIKELVGATAESHAVLATEDAYAHQKGYRSKRTMKSIIFHREFGEVARNTVNPEMLA